MRRGLISRSRVELPDAALDARLASLRAAMAGLDALLVYTNHTRPAAVSWLTGFVPYWSEALLVVTRAAPPILVVALTFRVKPWIERTSRVAEVVHTPRIGIEAARRIAGEKGEAAVGIVDYAELATSIADDLREAGPGLSFSDASELFAAVRGPADPAEIALTMRAATIADAALAAMPVSKVGIGAIIGAVEATARRLGAEEVYVAAAPDLDRDTRLVRLEGEPALGSRFALRASVAYKGSWVRRTVTLDRDPGADTIVRAEEAFAAAVAKLPEIEGFAGFRSYLVEGCRTSQPFDGLMGSRVAAPHKPGAGTIVSVQASLDVDGRTILVGAPALLGEKGDAAAILGLATTGCMLGSAGIRTEKIQ